MKNLTFFLLVLSCLFFGCHQKGVVANETQANTKAGKDIPLHMAPRDPTETVSGVPGNSWIQGKIKDVFPPESNLPSSEPCAKYPCAARVEVLSILRYGMNYHGHFNAGDELVMQFDFTLSPTGDIFPTLNKPLPGLMQGSIFEAEVFERPGEDGIYRIKLYEAKSEE